MTVREHPSCCMWLWLREDFTENDRGIRADVQDRQMTVQRSTRNHSETYMYDLKNKSTKYSGLQAETLAFVLHAGTSVLA